MVLQSLGFRLEGHLHAIINIFVPPQDFPTKSVGKLCQRSLHD